MSGVQLYQQLEINNEPLSRRLIFITGDTMNNEIQTFLNGSGRAFILKPFNPDELLLAAHDMIRVCDSQTSF